MNRKISLVYFLLFSSVALCSDESSLFFIYDMSRIQYVKNLPQDKFIICPESRESSLRKEEMLDTEFIPVKNYFSGEVEQKAFELCKQHSIKHIVATSEFDLLRAARLRQILNLPGMKYPVAQQYRDKWFFAESLKEKGLPVPESVKVESCLDLIDFSERCAFPIIIKPRRMAGSEGVKVMENQQQLQSFISANPLLTDYHESHYIAQKFIQGTLYHVDGICGEEKNIFWPSRYNIPNLEMLNGFPLSSQFLQRNEKEFNPLVDLSQKAIKSLMQLPYGTAFHFEIFCEEGTEDFYFIEGACRPPGAYVNDNWQSVHGIDLVNIMMATQAGQTNINIDDIALQNIKKYCTYLCFPSVEGRIVGIPEVCPFDFVENYIPHYKQGDTCKKSIAIDMGIADFVGIHGDSHQELLSRVQKVIEWFSESLVMDPPTRFVGPPV